MRKEIRDIYWKFAEDEIARKYEIGKRIKDSKGHYGEGFVAKVATDLDVSDTTLYSWRDVAQRYPEDTFNRVRAEAAKHNRRLKWTHFEHLAKVKDPGERVRIVNKVIKDGLNTTQTEDLVNEYLHPNTPVREPLPKPRSAAAGLKTMENLGEKFLTLCGEYDECVISVIGAKDNHDAKEIERLERVHQLLQDVGKAAGEKGEAIGELLSDIRKLEAEAERTKQQSTLPKRLRPGQTITADDPLFA